MINPRVNDTLDSTGLSISHYTITMVKKVPEY